MTVISRASDLSRAQKSICDDLMAALLQRNHHPVDPPTVASLRAKLWDGVFANNWTTESPNPGPGPLRKRTSEDTALYVGTLNEDVPIKSKGNVVPEYRRARSPVQFKASFAFDGKLTFYWIDDEGQKIPPGSVDIEGDLSYDEIKAMVAGHYDSNEMERIGDWNWAKVVHWGRARLTTVARSTTVGVGLIGRPQPVPDVHEDVDELQQIRLVEVHMKKEKEDENESS